jgi:hypothetical protein
MSVDRDREGPTSDALDHHIVLALIRNRPALTMPPGELGRRLPLDNPGTIAPQVRVLAGRGCPLGMRRWVASSGRDQYALRRHARDHLDRLARR